MNFTPQSRASRRGVQRLQLAPMIDVIFLLLIFFMTTTTLATPESELASGLQAQRHGGVAADLAPQILEVIRAGDQTIFRIGERTVRDREALRAVLASLPKDAGVFVKVSSAVDVADAAAALQTCRDAGYARVTYVPSQ
jgi:biopolymer transport protein ExbD